MCEIVVWVVGSIQLKVAYGLRGVELTLLITSFSQALGALVYVEGFLVQSGYVPLLWEGSPPTWMATRTCSGSTRRIPPRPASTTWTWWLWSKTAADIAEERLPAVRGQSAHFTRTLGEGGTTLIAVFEDGSRLELDEQTLLREFTPKYSVAQVILRGKTLLFVGKEELWRPLAHYLEQQPPYPKVDAFHWSPHWGKKPQSPTRDSSQSSSNSDGCPGGKVEPGCGQVSGFGFGA